MIDAKHVYALCDDIQNRHADGNEFDRGMRTAAKHIARAINALKAETQPTDGDYARMAETVGATVHWGDHSPAPVFNTWGQWGRFCDSLRAAPAQPEEQA